MDVYFQDKTATRGDGSFEDTSETGSEDDQGHPPDDWRTEDHGHRGQSRDSLFAILSDPTLSIPESLSFVIVPWPIIFVMHFPSILPNPLLYLNISSSSLVHSQFSLSQDKINSFELLNYKSAGLGGVTLISFSFVYCHS